MPAATSEPRERDRRHHRRKKRSSSRAASRAGTARLGWFRTSCTLAVLLSGVLCIGLLGFYVAHAEVHDERGPAWLSRGRFSGYAQRSSPPRRRAASFRGDSLVDAEFSEAEDYSPTSAVLSTLAEESLQRAVPQLRAQAASPRRGRRGRSSQGGGGAVVPPPPPPMRRHSADSSRSAVVVPPTPTPAQPPLLTPEFNLTLVTQTDMKRLDYLSECARRWLHPLSAALLLPPGISLQKSLRGRYFGSHVAVQGVESSAYNGSYPINALRNAALRAVRTTHFIVLDVDLWPSAELHRAVLSAPPLVLRRKYVALVIPAFQLDLQSFVKAEAHSYTGAFSQLPSTQKELRNCLEAKRCSTFYSRSSPETHSSTPYDAWWSAPLGSDLLPIQCFKNPRYEPYLVLPNQPTTPTYSEKFTGYGKNKIEIVTHLRFAGFRFYAVPGAFVAHMPHPKSTEKLSWETGPHRHQMDHAYKELVRDLVARYKRPRTPSCTVGHLL